MKKITVIGTGNVGATIAYTIAVAGLANELVLIDIAKAKAEGEAIDISQATPFFDGCKVYTGEYADAAGSDIVIFTSGVGRKPGQTRLELAQVNVNITKSVIPQITAVCPDATYIIVANPVDVLTYTFMKCSNLKESQIIGTGTLLDTARLRTRIGLEYDMAMSDVHAYVYGEHGDSSFIPWSIASVQNVPVAQASEKINPEVTLDYADIEEYVRKSGGRIIERKGATFYGISACVAHLVKCILNGIDTMVPVSTMMHGEYGIDDVCLSVMNVIGKNPRKVVMDLTEEEVAKLKYSAECLKNVINSVEI